MGSKVKKKKIQRNREATIIQTIFLLVEVGLRKSARMLGRTYNETNVIVYFGVIPLSWMVMVDYLLSFYWFTLGFICFIGGVLLTCSNFTVFCDQVFEKSVRFLLTFDQFGSNYTSTSVWICVAGPIVIYLTLGWLTIMKYTEQTVF